MALTRKRLITAKIESTYGVTSAPTESANAILCGSLNITPLAGEVVQRNIIRPYFGNSENIQVTQYATVDFEVEIAGSGTAGNAPQYGVLLKACGFAETLTAGTDAVYTPVTPSTLTDASSSTTIHFHNDGILHVLLGARGTVNFDLSVKKIPVMKFNFTGLLGTVSDSAMPAAPTYNAQTPVPVSTLNTTPVSFFGLSTAGSGATKLPLTEVFTLDMANDVKLRTLIGGEHVVITDRKPKGQIKFEVPTLATKNFFDIAKTSATDALSFTHGTVAGNIVVFDAPKVSLDAPKYGTNEGYDMLDAGLVLLPTNGNDELTITIK